MDRRSFLTATTLSTVIPGLNKTAQAEGYRRCDQIHNRLMEEHIDHWVTPLPVPPGLETRKLDTPTSMPTPPIGAVKQGTAPEFFWDPSNGSPPEASQWGEQAPGRPDDIFREVNDKGAPVPVNYGELVATDVVVEAVPGWFTRRIVYRQKPADGNPVNNQVLNQPWTGPVINARLGHPLVVRLRNDVDPKLMLDVSMHQHGGHIPAHSDGHPNFMLLPADEMEGHAAEERDYFYPNPLPLKVTGKKEAWEKHPGDWDRAEAQTTMWYHDHAEDITAHNALMGLASFYFLRDEVEDQLRDDGILPSIDHEIPLVFQDVCLCPVTERDQIQPVVKAAIDDYEKNHPGHRVQGEARIHFDPFDHNGTLGNVVLVNGAAFPVHDVDQEAYWFRLLNASLARFYNLEFWAIHPETRVPQRMKFLRFGKDSWLFKHPMKQNSVFLGMAARADLYVDFADLSDPEWDGYWSGDDTCEVFVVSTLNQKDGRGPGHGDNEQDINGFPRGMADTIREDRAAPMLLAKLRVKKSVPAPAPTSSGMTITSEIREHHQMPLLPPGDINVREFNFERGRGAWQINHRFYDACISNAVPELWSTELWILRNRSGGWWHPIHIHLESHQHLFIQARNHRGEKIVKRRPGYDPKAYERFLELSDQDILDGEKEWLESFHWQKPGFNDSKWWLDATQRSFDDTVWNLDIKHDTTVLGPNTEVHVLMRFRTFQGPFVFHCHNLNHEDMRMMFQFDPRSGLPNGPDEQLSVRKDFWYFHTDHPHCCEETKGEHA